MANGVYGTQIPTLIGNGDIQNYIDIYYCYSETRNSSDVDGSEFTKVDDVTSYMGSVSIGVGDNETTLDSVVEGLYNLRLPSTVFGRKGFYTIYIKPKEVPVVIMDVSRLTDFSDVRGIVLDTDSLPDAVKNDAKLNNGLVGYRVILLDDNMVRSKNVMIVTSNNKCSPVTSISSSSGTKSNSYRYNDNSTLTFLTVTPSTSLSFTTSNPFIGRATQKAYLVNTMFEPVCIELEMVENDADTIAGMISGSQLRDLNSGLITTFDKNNNIIMQHEMSTLKKTETGAPQYEVRENRMSNIDFSQTITDKIS